MATMTSTGAAGGTAGAEAAEAGRGAAWRACGDLHIGVRGAEQAQPTAARARYGSMHIYTSCNCRGRNPQLFTSTTVELFC